MELLAAAIAFILLLQSPSSTNATPSSSSSSSKLVDGICKKTGNYADCVSALELDPRTRSASDLKTLATISLEIAGSNTTASGAYIDKLANDKSTAPKLVPALKACASGYGSAAASFNSAKMELNDEPVSLSRYDAMVAGDWADRCESSLNDTQIEVPSVRARNYYLRLYSYIGFVITEQLGL